MNEKTNKKNIVVITPPAGTPAGKKAAAMASEVASGSGVSASGDKRGDKRANSENVIVAENTAVSNQIDAKRARSERRNKGGRPRNDGLPPGSPEAKAADVQNGDKPFDLVGAQSQIRSVVDIANTWYGSTVYARTMALTQGNESMSRQLQQKVLLSKENTDKLCEAGARIMEKHKMAFKYGDELAVGIIVIAHGMSCFAVNSQLSKMEKKVAEINAPKKITPVETPATPPPAPAEPTIRSPELTGVKEFLAKQQ